MLAARLGRYVQRQGAAPNLYRMDGERPLGVEWASYSAASPARFSRVTSPRAQGTYATRVDLVDGDLAYAETNFDLASPTGAGPFGERAELAMGNPTSERSRLFELGDEVWMSWQVWVPTAFPATGGTWNIVTQWKQLGGMGVPALAMGIERANLFNPGQTPGPTDGWTLMSADTATDSTAGHRLAWWPITRDRWTRFTMHVRFHTDPAIGFVELFGDLSGAGMETLFPKTSMLTMKNPDVSTGESRSRSHIRIGIYRDPAIVGNAYLVYDGFTVAPSRGLAEANAFSA